MDRQEIYDLIKEVKLAIQEPRIKDAGEPLVIASNKTLDYYHKVATRLFGINLENGTSLLPESAAVISEKIRASKSKATLRLYARSARYESIEMLRTALKFADEAQRNGDWDLVEKIVTAPKFKTLIELSKKLPSDYSVNWVAQKKRKSKKISLSRLPKDWREQMATESKGRFHIPMLVILLTGCRPAELEKGITLTRSKNTIRVHIKGAKVTEYAGQEFREFDLAEHPLTDELLALLDERAESKMLVKIDVTNSLTTYMRSIGKKIWPKKIESITSYTARHAMAAECKAAVANHGADEDLTSSVLGHVVDKTASYYGHQFQSGGISVVPSQVLVPHKIKQKVRARNEFRKNQRKRLRQPRRPIP